MKLEISPLTAPVGAVVTGWAAGEELCSEDRETILQALRQHLVLVFRGHRPPSDEALVRFARCFGNLVKGTEWFGDIVEFPEILPITNIVGEDGIPKGTGGSVEFGWHADYSYVERVGKESFLEAVQLPERPPRTCFCNQYVALETLPHATVEMLRPLRAFHSISGFVDRDNIDADEQRDMDTSQRAKRERDVRLGIERPPIPEATHPVILQHPESGREALYVSPGITRHILGMPPDESHALLDELHAHSTQPELVYCHEWEVGDLVMFDTFGAMHRRDAWDAKQPRFMRQLSTMC
jgi:taurine dioxygenase/pentalenolactone F synthase